MLPCLNLTLLLLQTGGLELGNHLCFRINRFSPLTQGQAAAAAGPHPDSGISPALLLLWLLLQLGLVNLLKLSALWMTHLDNVYHPTKHTSGPQFLMYSFIAGSLIKYPNEAWWKASFVFCSTNVHCTRVSIYSLFSLSLFSPLLYPPDSIGRPPQDCTVCIV